MVRTNIPDQAIFDIFRVDFPPEEAVGQWSSRLIIFDEAMPADERATLLEKLRDPAAFAIILHSNKGC